MSLAVRRGRARRALQFSSWGCAFWLLLLAAALVGSRSIGPIQQIFGHWSQIDPGELAQARAALLWNIAYLVTALVTIVISAGCVMRQEWARRAMRLLALLLALGAVATVVLMWRQIGQLDAFLASAQMQLQAQEGLLALLTHQRRSYLIAMVLMALLVPALAWLSWRVARLDVRAAFHARRLGAS